MEMMYHVAFRMGGRDNFRWRLTLGEFTDADAQQKAINLRSMGFPAVVRKAGSFTWKGHWVDLPYDATE